MDEPLPLAPCPLPRPLVELDDRWRQWIAENRLRDCTAESMVRTMTGAGLDGAACAAAIAAIEADPIFRAARRHQQVQRKLESVMANQQRLWQSDPDYAVVQKRSGMGQDEFMERHVRGSRPVVLTDVADDWPAMWRWSPQDLKERFGHLEVEIQADRHGDPQYEQNKLQHRRMQRLDRFVDHVLATSPANDQYLTANNELLRRPEFAPLLDDIGSLPAFCDRSRLAHSSSFWFGPAGTVTPLHHDTIMLLHTQVVGRKRWRFISPMETPRLYNFNGVFSPIDVDRPDLDRYPDFARATMLEVIVEPGETVFLPLGWWHQVTALDISLSFSFSNMAFPNDFVYQNASITDW